MREREIRILAVNPGSIYVGIAVFHGLELVDWGVRSIREKSVQDKAERLKRIMAEMMERDGINCFAIKRIHPARSSENLQAITRSMKEWARKEGMEVHEHSIKEIESSLLSSERRNKQVLMEEGAVRYSFLYPELEKERQNRNPYLVRMFEAVALGMKCLSDMEKAKGRKRISINHEC